MKKYIISLVALVGIMLFSSCEKQGGAAAIFFPVEKDVELGMQLKQEILSNPSAYPILDSNDYPCAYEHLYRIRDIILESGEVYHADRFAWELKIINDDDVLNAFAAPGGYIYVYTGLIRYLDTEDELAGVLGHEIAHADKRHSVNQMVKNYGVQTLLDIVLGNNEGMLSQIAAGLTGLSFSRKDESQADKYSVIYLCPTEYNAAGAAGFFEKILEEDGGPGGPAFLSTHPAPDNRVATINAWKEQYACNGDETAGNYAELLECLP